MKTTASGQEQISDKHINTHPGAERNYDAPHAFNTRDVAIFSVAHGTHDMYTAFLPPLLPVFIEKLAISRTEAGMLQVVMRLPALLQPVIGHLSDRADLRFLVIMAPALTATLISFVGYVPNYWMLLLVMFLVGTSSGGLHAVAPAVAGRLSGHNLGRGMSLWMVGGELGWTVGPILVVTVVDLLTIRGLPIVMVIGWAASIFLFIRLRKFKEMQVKSLDTVPVREVLSQMKSIMILISGILLLRSFLDASLVVYLPTFLTEQGISLWMAGASVTIVQSAGIVGTLVGGPLSDRIGRKKVLLISLLSPPLLMFVFLLLGNWVRFGILFVMGLVTFAVNPVFLALVQESFPENRALANSIFLAVNFLTGALAVFLVGLMGDLWSLQRAYFLSTSVMLLALPILFFLPSKKRQ